MKRQQLINKLYIVNDDLNQYLESVDRHRLNEDEKPDFQQRVFKIFEELMVEVTSIKSILSNLNEDEIDIALRDRLNIFSDLKNYEERFYDDFPIEMRNDKFYQMVNGQVYEIKEHFYKTIIDTHKNDKFEKIGDQEVLRRLDKLEAERQSFLRTVKSSLDHTFYLNYASDFAPFLTKKEQDFELEEMYRKLF